MMLICSSEDQEINLTHNIGVIVENKEKYISFTTDVIVDQYVDASGEVKEKEIQHKMHR